MAAGGIDVPHARSSLPRMHRTYWRRKLERNVERDQLNKKELESAGWKVLEVWEHEVRDAPPDLAVRIKASARANYAPQKI